MSEDDLVIRAQLRDEAGPGLQNLRRNLRQTKEEAERVAVAGVKAGRGIDVTGAAARRTRSDFVGLHRNLLTVSSSMGDTLFRAASRGAIGLGLLTGATAAFGVKGAMNLEQGRIQLEGLTGSAAEADRIFTHLKKLDPKVPFDIGQLQQMTVQLSNAGIRGQELFDMLQGVSDVAAGTADPNLAATRVARAISQMKGAGVILAEEVNQLVDAGVAVGPALERAYGIGLAEFRKMQAGGGAQLAPEPLFAALFGMRTGMAERVATETLGGLLSGVRSRVMLELSDSASPLMQTVKDELPQIEEGIGGLIRTVGPPLFGLRGDVTKLATDALPAVEPVLRAIFGGLGGLLDAAGPGIRALQPLGGELGDSLANTFVRLEPVMPEVVDSLGLLIGMLPEFADAAVTVIIPLVRLTGLVIKLVDVIPGADHVAGILLVTLLGYRAVASVVGGLHAFAAALGFIGTTAETSGNKAVIARGKLLGLAGIAAGGIGVAAGYGGVVSGKNSLGEDAAFVANSTMLGAGIGSFIPGVGTAAGAGLGAAFGLGSTVFGHAFGDPVVPGGTMNRHLAAGGGAAGLRITSGIRGFGLRSAASGHVNGSAVDVAGPGLDAYVRRVRAQGGWATMEGHGASHHAHADFGDAFPTGRGGRPSMSGGGARYSIYAPFLGPVNSTVDVERGFERALRKTERKRHEGAFDPVEGRV